MLLWPELANHHSQRSASVSSRVRREDGQNRLRNSRAVEFLPSHLESNNFSNGNERRNQHGGQPWPVWPNKSHQHGKRGDHHSRQHQVFDAHIHIPGERAQQYPQNVIDRIGLLWLRLRECIGGKRQLKFGGVRFANFKSTPNPMRRPLLSDL